MLRETSGEFQRTMIAVNDYHEKERNYSRKLNGDKIVIYKVTEYLILLSSFYFVKPL